jgi:hypothetical protein
MAARNILRYIIYKYPLRETVFLIKEFLNISDTNLTAKK